MHWSQQNPLPTMQGTTLHMDIRWSILRSDWLYSLKQKMEKLYTVSKNKTGSWLWLRSRTPYCQIQTQIEEIGKTTRPFKYGLNQTPYDYTVEMRNRFKGLDVITECLMNYGQKFLILYRRQESRPPPRKRNAKIKMAGWGGLTNSWEKKRSEKQRRKGKLYTFECRVPKNSKEW